MVSKLERSFERKPLHSSVTNRGEALQKIFRGEKNKITDFETYQTRPDRERERTNCADDLPIRFAEGNDVINSACVYSFFAPFVYSDNIQVGAADSLGRIAFDDVASSPLAGYLLV